MIAAFYSSIHAHPTLFALAAYYVGSAFTASLPAPRKDDPRWYVFLFQFVNTLAANLVRAYATRVENSPNFEAAVDLHNQQAKGDLQTSAKPAEEPPGGPPAGKP